MGRKIWGDGWMKQREGVKEKKNRENSFMCVGGGWWEKAERKAERKRGFFSLFFVL